MLNKLKKAVLEGDDELAQEFAKKALKKKIEPLKIVNEGIIHEYKKQGNYGNKMSIFIQI